MNASSNVRKSSASATLADPNALNSSSHNGSPPTTLRPRVRRLISGLDEGDEASHDPHAAPRRIASPVNSSSTPFDSRSVSPIPQTRLSRPLSSHGSDNGGLFGKRGAGSGRKGGAESPIASLWGSSVNALQGIASDLLGNDVATADVKGNVQPRAMKAFTGLGGTGARSASTGTVRSSWAQLPIGNWGPGSSAAIGLGTKEGREHALRAQKRKDMLTRQDPSHLDSLGKFKRRTSEDHGSFSAPPGDNEDREALVYIHPVSKNDTMAGITIRYNISANVLRKANRMWPNDSIQTRTSLMLPVDACGVKGKPVQNGEAMDLLTLDDESQSAAQIEEVHTSLGISQPDGTDSLQRDRTNSTTSSIAGTNTNHRRTTSLASSAAISGTSETPWEHDSWVILPNNAQPTQLARLSRRALGYFPPARRKSNNNSDFNTPSTSLDLTRPPTHETDSLALVNSPSVTGSFDHPHDPQRPPRTRRLSNASNGYFPSYLAGPGGVGTMSRSVHSPGPGQDGLNKMFARHLPDVAPPKNQTNLYQPDLPVWSVDGTPAISGQSTPSGAGASIDLANVGGAIEGWMRRVAAQGRKVMEGSSSGATAGQGGRRKGAGGGGGSTGGRAQHVPRASLGVPGSGTGGVGDLIEMRTPDEFELAPESESDEEEERGRRGSVIHHGATGGKEKSATSGTSYFDSVGGMASRGRVGGKKDGKDD